MKRLDAGELSSVLCKGSLDGEQKPLSKDALLQDMLGNAKTTAGRLFLAKKMLQLPAAAVKAFAGTKEGLSILNNWILVCKIHFPKFLTISSNGFEISYQGLFWHFI